MASELNKLPRTFQSKIDSEKAAVQIDFNKYKYNMQIEMNNMKYQWVDAFKQMKLVLYKSIQNVKNDISTVQNERNFLYEGSDVVHNRKEVEQYVERKLQTTPLNRFVNMEDIVRSLKRDGSLQNHLSSNINLKEAIEDKLNHKN